MYQGYSLQLIDGEGAERGSNALVKLSYKSIGWLDHLCIRSEGWSRMCTIHDTWSLALGRTSEIGKKETRVAGAYRREEARVYRCSGTGPGESLRYLKLRSR